MSAEKVFYILDLEGVELENAIGLARPEGHVAFDNVTFAYKEGEPVLRNITFEAKKARRLRLLVIQDQAKAQL